MQSTTDLLYERLLAQSHNFHKVVDFDSSKEKIIKLDFSEANKELSGIDVGDRNSLGAYINDKLKAAKAKFAIGGYNENRTLYKSSALFNAINEKASPVGGDL